MDIIHGSDATIDIPNLVSIVANDIWSNGQLEQIDDVYSDNFSGGIIGSHQFDDPTDYKAWVKETRAAIPDLDITMNKLFVGGTIVCGTWTATGTHTGEFDWLGLDPTHEDLEYDGIVIDRINEGEIIEEYHAGDYVTMLSQLGVLSR